MFVFTDGRRWSVVTMMYVCIYSRPAVVCRHNDVCLYLQSAGGGLSSQQVIEDLACDILSKIPADFRVDDVMVSGSLINLLIDILIDKFIDELID